MSNIKQLLNEIATSRQNYLDSVTGLDEQQAQWKPDSDSWNAVEITEHLFWAEQGGILGMWKTLLGVRAGTLSYENAKPHEGLTIEEIILRTWKEREIVPAVAAPRMGGPLAFWAESLKGLQSILEALGNEMNEDELQLMAHPHPISGPLDFGQRFEFLRFHIDRHIGQVENLKKSM